MNAEDICCEKLQKLVSVKTYSNNWLLFGHFVCLLLEIDTVYSSGHQSLLTWQAVKVDISPFSITSNDSEYQSFLAWQDVAVDIIPFWYDKQWQWISVHLAWQDIAVDMICF